MYEMFIPLVGDFKLRCLREDIIFNRLNPIELESGNHKVRRYEITSEEKKHIIVCDLIWKDESLFDGIAILHFNGILKSFLYGNLEQNREYGIYSEKTKNGLVIQMHCEQGVFLNMQCVNEDKNLCIAESLNKVECRILSDLLVAYISKNELREDDFDGHIRCSYGEEEFALDVENL